MHNFRSKRRCWRVLRTYSWSAKMRSKYRSSRKPSRHTNPTWTEYRSSWKKLRVRKKIPRALGTTLLSLLCQPPPTILSIVMNKEMKPPCVILFVYLLKDCSCGSCFQYDIWNAARLIAKCTCMYFPASSVNTAWSTAT